MGLTSIAWADYTFNLWIGCRKVSPGCAHCYAESYARRFWSDPWKTGVYHVTSPQYWKQPLAWDRKAAEAGRPATVFCGSLCDICDPAAPEGAIDRLKGLIEATPHLIWLLLTKRPERLGETFGMFWLGGQRKHVWIGVSAENSERCWNRLTEVWNQGWNVPQLRLPPMFVSVEPLLGDVLVPLANYVGGPYRIVDWVIVGGETGPAARPCNLFLIDSLMGLCHRYSVPLFVKQAGSRPEVGSLGPCSQKAIDQVESWREFPEQFSRPFDPALRLAQGPARDGASPPALSAGARPASPQPVPELVEGPDPFTTAGQPHCAPERRRYQ